eukprot:jgi/Mesvir1/26074/Mv26355-RA.1
MQAAYCLLVVSVMCHFMLLTQGKRPHVVHAQLKRPLVVHAQLKRPHVVHAQLKRPHVAPNVRAVASTFSNTKCRQLEPGRTAYTQVPRELRLANLWQRLDEVPHNACSACLLHAGGREGFLGPGISSFSRFNHTCTSRPFSSTARCDWWAVWGLIELPVVNCFLEKDLSCKPTLFLDVINFREVTSGYWTSIVWNGFNNYGFRPRNMDSARWNTHFAHHLAVRPWKAPAKDLDGKVVTIMGQRFDDAALWTVWARYSGRRNSTSGSRYAHLVGPNIWYQETVDEIRRLAPGVQVVFRPHPQHPQSPQSMWRCTHPNLPWQDFRSDGTVAPQGARLDVKGTLAETIAKSYCIITMNSNAAIESVLGGTPVIVTDEGSMAWDVAVHRVADIFNLYRGDRMQWLYDLSYAQWRSDEITKGLFLPLYFDKEKVR